MMLTQPRRPFPLGYAAQKLTGTDRRARDYQAAFWRIVVAIPAAILLLHVAPQVLFGWPSALVMIFGAQ